jgi:competence protein ComFA
VLYSIPEPNLFSVEEPIMAWKGKLSPQQSEASNEIIHSIKKKETHLIWAVAGAGKTEMLFKGIEEAIRRQYRICIASPRVDVCLELAPRIQAAFPRVSLAVLYGEMEVAYTYTQIVVATTHQLYRFKEAFDVMIIDEVDAFPFHLDEALQFSVEKAKKKQSAVLYLTATPDRKTQRKVTQKMLKATILPARYHRHPLPEPTYKWCVNWRRNLIKDPQQTPVVKEMIQLLEQEKRFLVFVPSVEWMHQIEKNFRNIFEKASFECVHSSDPDRKEKVQKMRDQTVDFLITTTILIDV